MFLDMKLILLGSLFQFGNISFLFSLTWST